MQDGTEFENGLALLGKHYRSSCVFRFSGYKIASLLAGKDLPVYTAASGEIDEVNRLTDMQLGAMLASEWGVHIPPGMMARAGLTLNVPGTLTVH